MNDNESTKNNEEGEVDYVLKIILVGDSGVGKTNILTRYVKGTYNENHQNTLGVEFATKKIILQDIVLRLQIWDTAGQERFQAITSSFYKNSSGALVVFDLTKENSFIKVNSWIKDMREIAGERIIIILIGNKSDLINERVISKERAEEMAQKFGKI